MKSKNTKYLLKNQFIIVRSIYFNDFILVNQNISAHHM